MFNKYKNFIDNQKGLFLAELIIGMVVMVIIMGAIFGIISAASKSFLYNTAQSSNIAGARDILDNVTSSVRNSTTISSPALGQTASEIDFIVNNDGIQRKISTVAGSLVINNGASQVTIARNDVQSIQFIRDASNTKLLTVSIQLKSSSYSNSPSFSSSLVVIMPSM